MKLIAIGDTHGRAKWKAIVNKETDADKIIFIGDYFDSHGGGYNSGGRQIANFKDILAFKQANPDKVIMLTGNHDFHYIRGIGETYSGYQAAYAIEIGELVEKAIKDGDMQMAYLYENYLFTHAGLTKTWARNNLGVTDPIVVDDALVEHINNLLVYQPRKFVFASGEYMSMTGDDVTQGPIWVRPMSLKEDMVDNITCVVGHTPARQLGINPAFKNLILIDCLGDTYEYLIINDGTPEAGIIKISND